MKGARRTPKRQGAGFADLMAVPTQPRRGVITGMSRFQQHSTSTTPTATAQTTPSSSTPSTPRPSPADEDWDSLLNISPRRRISPIKSKLGSRSRPGSVSMDSIPPRTTTTPSRNINSSRQSTPPVTSPAPRTPAETPQLPPITSPPKPKPTPSARSSLAPVPSFLAGWEGADGWGDEPSDESDPEVDDEAWGGWGDTVDISIPEETSGPTVSDVVSMPTVQTSVSRVTVDHETSKPDATEQVISSTDAVTHSAIPQQPLEETVKLDDNTSATGEDHPQHPKQEDTKSDSQLVASEPRASEKSVNQFDTPALNALGDGDVLGQWEEPRSLSLQSDLDEPKQLGSPDDAEKSAAFKECAQDVRERVGEDVETPPTLSNQTTAANEEVRSPGGIVTEALQNSAVAKVHLEEANQERKRILDDPIVVVPDEAEQQPRDPEAVNTSNGVEGGAWGEWDGIEDMPTSGEHDATIINVPGETRSPSPLHTPENIIPIPVEEGSGTANHAPQQLESEVSFFAGAPSNDAITDSVKDESIENDEADKNQDKTVAVAFDTEKKEREDIQSSENDGEMRVCEDGWGDSVNVGLNNPNETDTGHDVADLKSSFFPSDGSHTRKEEERTPISKGHAIEGNEIKHQSLSVVESPYITGMEKTGMKPEKSSPPAVDLQAELIETRRTNPVDHSEEDKVHVEQETQKGSLEEAQQLVPEEVNITAPGLTFSEPDLTSFDVSPEARTNEFDGFDVQDGSAEVDAEAWGGWGDFEDMAVLEPPAETSDTTVVENHQDDVVPDAKPPENYTMSVNRPDTEDKEKHGTSHEPVCVEKQKHVARESERVIGQISDERQLQNDRQKANQDETSPNASLTEEVEISVQGEVADGVVSGPEERVSQDQTVAQNESMIFGLSSDTAVSMENKDVPSEGEFGWGVWGAFSEAQTLSTEKAERSQQLKTSVDVQPAGNSNTNSSLLGSVKSKTMQPAMATLAGALDTGIAGTSISNTPVVGIGEDEQCSKPSSEAKAVPGVMAASLPGKSNEEHSHVQSVYSGSLKERSNVQTSSLTKDDFGTDPVQHRNEAGFLPLTAVDQTQPAHGTNEQHGSVESMQQSENNDVDAAFFGLSSSNMEEIKSVPLATENDIDDDIWGGWEETTDISTDRRGNMQNMTGQFEDKSPSSLLESKQRAEDDGNNETTMMQKDTDLTRYIENKPRSEAAGSLNESSIPIAHASVYHGVRDVGALSSNDVAESRNEYQPQAAISSSYWTEKLNSVGAQEQESNESPTNYQSARAAAYAPQSVEGVRSESHEDNSWRQRLEAHERNHVPEVAVDSDFPSSYSFVGDAHMGMVPVVENVRHKEEIGEKESTTLKTQPNAIEHSREVRSPFVATSPSETEHGNEIFKFSGASEGHVFDQGDRGPRFTETHSEAYDPFAPTDTFGDHFGSEERVAFEAPDEQSKSQVEASFIEVDTRAKNDALDNESSRIREQNECSEDNSDACNVFSSLQSDSDLPNKQRLKDSRETMVPGDESAQIISSSSTLPHSHGFTGLVPDARGNDSVACSQHENQSVPSSSTSIHSQSEHVTFRSEAKHPISEQSSLAFEQSPGNASTKNDFESISHAPNVFGMIKQAGNFDEELHVLDTNQHDRGLAGDLKCAQDRSVGVTDMSYETDICLGAGSEFQAYAPKPSGLPNIFVDGDQDSYTPSIGNKEQSSEDATEITNIKANDFTCGLHNGYQEQSELRPKIVEHPGELEPYKTMTPPGQTFGLQETHVPGGTLEPSPSYAPHQSYPTATSGHAVQENTPYPTYPTSQAVIGLSSQSTAEISPQRYALNEPYNASPYRPVSENVSAAYWNEGVEEQKSVEASVVGGLPISTQIPAVNVDFQPYQPSQNSFTQSLEVTSESNITKDPHPTNSLLPSAYETHTLGNHVESTPNVLETPMESPYMDASMFSYPFSIMDTTPSGDMVHPGARPIISWSFAGSFVTVFPSSLDDRNENQSLPPESETNSHNVQVFDVNLLGADGANDDWLAAAEAVEPVSYPVKMSQLEPYEKMCDELSQFSAGLSGPAAESRAALWRVLALLCRASDTDWRKSANRIVCGPTSVPLYGASIAPNHADESTTNPLSKISETTEREVLNEVERLLTEGKAEDAVNHAKTSGLWSLGLILAGMIDKKLYSSVLCEYAKATLPEGSALQTLCFSLSDNDSEISRRITSPAGLADWRKNVGMLLANGASLGTDSEKRNRFLHLINLVGDALNAQHDDVVGSHVCYLLSGRLETLDRSGVCLLGANPTVTPGRPRSLGSPAAILQSLVFEATVNARSAKTFPHLLPFRLLLALEIASVGRTEAALAHCIAISAEVRAIFESGNNIASQVFTPPFLSSLESFEQQLRGNLGLQEQGETSTRLSALGKSLTSVFTRGLKDQPQQPEKEASHKHGNENVMAGTHSFSHATTTLSGYPNVSEQNLVHQAPHLSLGSHQANLVDSVPIPDISNQNNGTIDQSTRKENSGKEKWNYLVQKTVGLIAPADYDLSPPPPSRAPPPAFGHQGQPSPLGLSGGAVARAPAPPVQTLTPSHIRSASVGALPNEFLGSNQFTSTMPMPARTQVPTFGDERNISAPQLELSSRTTDQAVFNGIAVQKTTREEKYDAVVHRRSASDMTLQSQTSEKKPPLHPKKPSRASNLTDTSTEAPQQNKGWRERLREKLTAAFSGGPRRAHMGEENKFVFDKKRGRWVIEGEDPEEEEDIPPPPPDDDNMYGSEGNNVQTSSSYDPLPNPLQAQTPTLLRSQSAQDARVPNSNFSGSLDQAAMPLNPMSSYPASLDNSVGGDDGSATSVASAASAPVPYSSAPSLNMPTLGNSNKYRAAGGRRPSRRAYVDTFNKGRPPAPMSNMPTPARPAVPAFGGVTSATGGGYKIFTPTPVPSTSTGNSETGQGANSSASVVESSDQMTASGSELSSTQYGLTNTSSHSDALPPRPPSHTSSLGSGRQPRMMA